MGLTPIQKSLLEDELREIYREYMRRKDALENEIRSRILREIAEERGSMLRTLSETMHEYHRKGLPIAGIRRAVKKYNNTEEFNKLWLAYTPEEDFTLAPGRSAAALYRQDTERENVLWWLRDTKGKTLAHEVKVWYDEGEPWPSVDREELPFIAANLGGLSTFLEEAGKAFEELGIKEKENS